MGVANLFRPTTAVNQNMPPISLTNAIVQVDNITLTSLLGIETIRSA